jgi:hypothetical protein
MISLYEAALHARIETLEAAITAIRRYCNAPELQLHARLNLVEAVCKLVTPPPATSAPGAPPGAKP